MEDLFITYNQSLALKKLGFDEPCLYSYYQDGTIGSGANWVNWNESKVLCSRPLKSQVFEWFRKEHQLFGTVLCDLCWNISGGVANSYGDAYDWDSEKFKTYEEAESDCIDKLIEIVKGERHSSSKVKTLASVDVEKLESIQKFVDYAVTESRFNQACENVFPNDEPIDVRKMGDVIRWVVNDVIKEEMDTMVENQVEPKEVNKYISSKVREMFFKLSV